MSESNDSIQTIDREELHMIGKVVPIFLLNPNPTHCEKHPIKIPITTSEK